MSGFETQHKILIDDSRYIDSIKNSTVNLVVTSPPYPMIRMWDEQFGNLNSDIKKALESKNGDRAFSLMHKELDKVWKNISKILKDGGIACINIGDTTRKLDETFQLYPNHSRVIESFRDLGFEVLPNILWRKPTNSPTKFMGSGTIPPNAYVTLEHEHILIFRKNGTRNFQDSKKRYESSYFWEERNKWFSDVWMDITGTLQKLENENLRERTAAYPFELVYRLIQMYSVYNDTVLDPFLGTGTTSMAAMVSGRNSIGIEIEPEFKKILEDKIDKLPNISKNIIENRIEKHKEFIKNKKCEKFKYQNTNYDFPVRTKQEKNMKFYTIKNIKKLPDRYITKHRNHKNISK